MEQKNVTRVFLTGATGVMGSAGLKELLRYPDKYQITVLARSTQVNKKKLKSYEGQGVRIIWGDLENSECLKKGIENSDIVLHVGGMVSPKADLYPEKTMKVNVNSMSHIAEIVKDIERKEEGRAIKVVYIGSVAQYGSKMPPDHWGKIGDPLNVRPDDAYAMSKKKAEEILKEASLKKWVSIRQTSILHIGLLKNIGNPMIFHTPLNGVLEWITTEDSGRLLERVCRPEVPDSFWGKCYNAGGGEKFRIVNLDFERKLLKALGCPSPEKIFEPNWFCEKNFHGMWFKDSDILDSILHYRDSEDSFDKAISRMKRTLPLYFRLAPIAPSFIIKKVMKRVASKPGLGPLSWIKNNDIQRIKAAWGSREAYESIPGWENFKIFKPEESSVSSKEIEN